MAVFLISCTTDASEEPTDLSKEVEDLIKVKEISNSTHTVELFSASGDLMQGYNKLTLRITDKSTNEFITNTNIEWMPVMHMTSTMHSCPNSLVKKTEGKQTLFEGFVIFQMATMGNEGWTLTIDYSIDGINYQVEDDVEVMMSEKQVVSVFMGEDEIRYVLALIDPLYPEVQINDISASLYKMDSMMKFSLVENCSIELDPRMPSMGNHSSPNNEHLVYDAMDKTYKGKLSLTMTGYWVLNLRLMDQNQDLVKGEMITEDHEKSSLFFELEF